MSICPLSIDHKTVPDRIYGEILIPHPILQQLLASPAISRLQGIYQHGISALLGRTEKITRLEHSLGVYYLVNKLGGSLEANSMALLHDVSHTALSHVFDFVFQSSTGKNYHETVKELYFNRFGLASMLRNCGFHWRSFLQEDFPLLDQPLPRLCADRLVAV